MSSIPNSAMHHARATHDTPDAPAKSAKPAKPEDGIVATVTKEVTDTAREVTEVVKAHPKTAAAIGVAVLAGAAAAVAAPFLKAKAEEPAKPAPKGGKGAARKG